MGLISNSWNSNGSTGLYQKVTDKVKSEAPLKNRIDRAQKELELQITKLDRLHLKLKQKHDALFSRAVDATKNRENSIARILSTEVGQIRKVKDTVENTKLALQQVQIRLGTVSELGDVVVTLSPCMSLIKGLGTSIGGIMPEANASMQNLSDMLGDVLSGSSMGESGVGHVQHQSNPDSLAILEEAKAIAEGQVRSNLPEPPTNVPQRKTLQSEII